MMDYNDNIQDGIFVINGQIFSVNDLMDVMRRHGLRVKVNQDGLSIDGERITSISNFNDNKCPLATTCEKRVALIEFLKLQKNHQTRNLQAREYQDDIFTQSIYSESIDEPQIKPNFSESRKEESRRDFIRPNNHDLFEGNVSGSVGLFDEPTTNTRGLFDEPDLFSESEDNLFEDSFYQEKDNFDDRREQSQDDSFSNNRRRSFSSDKEQPFCSECGFDLKPSWVSCPNCGYRVIKKYTPNEKNKFY